MLVQINLVSYDSALTACGSSSLDNMLECTLVPGAWSWMRLALVVHDQPFMSLYQGIYKFSETIEPETNYTSLLLSGTGNVVQVLECYECARVGYYLLYIVIITLEASCLYGT